jgi:hypothetical protein
MSYDALMRWEWEGGTPASVSEPARAKPAENTDIRSQPTNRRQPARRVGSVSTLPSGSSQGDGRER